MEEILASIRRIISEDEQQEPAAAAPKAQPAPAKPGPAPTPVAAKPLAPVEEAVLDLTDQVAEDGTVVSLQAAAEANAARKAKPAPQPEPAKAPDEEIELAEAEPEPVPVASPAPRYDSDLISRPAADAATASLAAFAQAVDRGAAGAPIGVGGHTLEDIVKEIMRPMIRDWLDAHLPHLVERLVRREIERMSHTAQMSEDR